VRIYTDLASSAVYCAETGFMLAESPDARNRVQEWRKGLATKPDAAKIIAAGDCYRGVAVQCGWKLRNQAEYAIAKAEGREP